MATLLSVSTDDLIGHHVEISEPQFTSSETAQIKKYRLLDDYGKEAVSGVLDVEYRRCEADRAARSEAETDRAASPPAPDIRQEKVLRYIVPEYRAPMSAGVGEAALLEYPEDMELSKAPPRGTSYVAHVKGDSMEPVYHDGDVVFVHSAELIPVGAIGVFYMDGQQWIKELGDGVLISKNPDYPPKKISDDIECQGFVIGVCDNSYFV